VLPNAFFVLRVILLRQDTSVKAGFLRRGRSFL
jgi:hypothetical protein